MSRQRDEIVQSIVVPQVERHMKNFETWMLDFYATGDRSAWRFAQLELNAADNLAAQFDLPVNLYPDSVTAALEAARRNSHV